MVQTTSQLTKASADWLKGLMLAASVDDESVWDRLLWEDHSNSDFLKTEAELSQAKTNVKMIVRRLNRNSESRASIEAEKYTIQCVILKRGALSIS